MATKSNGRRQTSSAASRSGSTARAGTTRTGARSDGRRHAGGRASPRAGSTPTARATPTTRATRATRATPAKGRRPSDGRRTTTGTRESPRRRTHGLTAHDDALAMLKADHRHVEELFSAFEKAGATARKTKQRLVDEMVEALSLHTGVEESLVYPAARAASAQAKGMVLEALEEHHVVEWELLELTRLEAADERFDAKVTVMMANVRRHIREEERHLFPALRRALDRRRLVELGEEMEQAKERLPTRPHPGMSEDHENAVAGAITGVIDRVRDSVRKSADH